jgi:hypothetical protein
MLLLLGWPCMTMVDLEEEEAIGVNHTEGASAAAASLQGRLRANNRRLGGGGKARNPEAQGEEAQHLHCTKPEQYGVRCAEWEVGFGHTRGNSMVPVCWVEKPEE